MKKNKSLLTGLSLLVLFFTIINTFRFEITKEKKQIYYSDFLNLLANSQVQRVSLQENYLTGKLKNGEEFKTTIISTPELIESLRAKKVVIDIKPPAGNSILLSILLQWGPLLFLVGIWIFMMRKAPGQNSGGIFSIGKSKAKRYEDQEDRRTTFKDVAGANEAKEDLEEIIDFLKDPTKFSKIGGKVPKGVLMIGPPGTGKTLLAKAVAGEAHVPFFSISGSDFVEMFVGVGASRVRELFEDGRKNAPCIIFIDEIDAVGRHRGAGLGSSHDEREQTLNQMLVEMDGFDAAEGVIIIAATNRPDILDPALLRPGRFDRQVYVPLPDIKGRHEILKVHSQKIKIAKNVNLKIIARGTPGFSGAQLANLINEAALWAARNNSEQVTLKHLEWARDKVMMGLERKSMIMTDEEKEATAYHEAGHAIASAYVKKADPIHKITILPRGKTLGVTSFLPEADRFSMDKEYLESKITITMGGRAAESLIYNDYSTGAENDLKNATEIAYSMVCSWGMSERIGALTVSKGDSGNFLAMDYNTETKNSEATQIIIDEEIQTLLKKCYQNAKQILSDHIEQLHAVAKLLLEKETISHKQFHNLLENHQNPLSDNNSIEESI